jgi:hypothetical protein
MGSGRRQFLAAPKTEYRVLWKQRAKVGWEKDVQRVSENLEGDCGAAAWSTEDEHKGLNASRTAVGGE